LNAGLWFRRGRLLILPPAYGQHGRCQIDNPLIHAVQIPRATSARHLGTPINVSLGNEGGLTAAWCTLLAT
ncbi:hypothetical protein, partial [Sphingomonas sp.]|uniref:hypothetical protein n=1 Tax=Sphingomonas sp. TaxID=28214 RepID=UPI0031E1657D